MNMVSSIAGEERMSGDMNAKSGMKEVGSVPNWALIQSNPSKRQNKELWQ